MKEIADREEILVPIRIEVESDGYRLRDTFVWNLCGEQLDLWDCLHDG